MDKHNHKRHDRLAYVELQAKLPYYSDPDVCERAIEILNVYGGYRLSEFDRYEPRMEEIIETLLELDAAGDLTGPEQIRFALDMGTVSPDASDIVRWQRENERNAPHPFTVMCTEETCEGLGIHWVGGRAMCGCCADQWRFYRREELDAEEYDRIW